MNAVGQGTLLAGRYRLERRHSTSPTMSLWRGTDTTLDRPVAVRIVASQVAAETLDAARRAALVDDPRLVRLLDVARTPSDRNDTSTTYIVSEWVDGRSLADLLDEDGPLPAEHVRMMVGEAAQALTTASRAGLHHLALEPTSILLTREGGIKVQGLAVDAAAAGSEEVAGERAERSDAVRLVALMYAGLTGRWPLDVGAGALERAPQVSSVPASPANLVAGVPGDLDSLCSVTFGPGEDGPRSPAELAHQLKPWNTGLTHEPAPRRVAAAATDRSRPRTFPTQVTDQAEREQPAPPDPITTDESELFSGVFTTDPDLTAHAGTDKRNRILLAVIGALVLVGLGLAIWAMGGSTSTTPSETATGTQAETAGPATGATPVIAEITGFDPQGDGAEGNDPRLAIDGNPDTNWRTSRYNTAQFGNLKKGVGLLVKLEQNSSVHEVTVRSNGTGGAIEVRAANGPTLDGSQVLGAGPAGDLVVRPDSPVNTQYLIIWVTELPVTDGANRAEIAEVSIK